MLRRRVWLAVAVAVAVGCGAAGAPKGAQAPDVEGITSVTFELFEKPSPRGDTVHIVVTSAESMSRGGANFSLRVGEETAGVGTFNFSDGSLNFYLDREPAEGAIVYAGWSDAPLEATRFRYHRPK